MICRKLLLGFLFLLAISFNANARNTPFAAELDSVPVKERYGDFLNNKKSPFDLKDPSIIQKNVEYDAKSGQYIISEKIGDDYYRMPTYMTFSEYLKYRESEQQQKQFQKFNGLGTKSKSDFVGRKFDDPIKKLQELIEKNVVDRLFGGTELSITPQGNIDIPLGFALNQQKNPTLPVYSQRFIFQPIFDLNVNVNLQGQIGEKMKINTAYNSKAAFNFDNQIKLNYDTQSFGEDEILKGIGIGNVSLPLKSTLIQGASSLFGLKLETQFGNLKIATVIAQQQSRRQQINIQQGGQKYKFAISADQYDENRHFFLTQSNRDNYEPALVNLPQISSLFAVTYLEVWVTNDRTETQNVRDIIAFTDLGEPDRLANTKWKSNTASKDINNNNLPSNSANKLYAKLLANNRIRDFDGAIRELVQKGGDFEMQPTRDFEKVRARKLRSDEFSFDPRLGFISVNFQLRPNQTLGVAFTYKYNGKEYKVGELATNAPAAEVQVNKNPQPGQNAADTIPQMLFVKLLKGTTPRLDIPLWDLMMKNIYSLGASNVNKEGFRLDIMYNKPGDGERRFLSDGDVKGGTGAKLKIANLPLLSVFNLDKLNTQGDPQPDGVFDFVEGITINTRQGKIIFPVLEPFGKTLSKKINDDALSRQFVYQQLYDTTITAAREFPELNIFTIKGEYKGTSNSEYQLGTFNLPKGSVKVISGSQVLQENVDYEVNYGTGTVKILNEAYVNSSVPVSVTFEDSQLFGFQQKRMFGTRMDYKVNKDLTVGGTFMKLWEVPFTQKVNVNEDPISNAVYGLDFNYSKEAPWLTKLADRLPFYSTKAPSSVSLTAEGAYMRPGHARAINKITDNNTKEVVDEGGVVYIDDFEGSTNGTDLRQPQQWFLASIPQNDLENHNPRFPESAFINDRISNLNRARLMWYNINEQGGVGNGNVQSVRNPEDEKSPYFGFITDQEIFKNKDYGTGQGGTFPARIFDLTYLPSDRGPYNFDEPGSGIAGISKGMDDNGRLNRPETRWGGIMRALPYNDFEASNVEFMDIWMLSPYLKNDASQFNKGTLHIDLGNISEDILRDSRQFYENGLPGGNGSVSRLPTDKTALARVPRITPITNAFDLNETIRTAQDVGLDGWDDNGETNQVPTFIQKVQTGVNPTSRAKILADPANDNFVHFLDETKFTNGVSGVLDRYHDFNNTQNNSKPAGTNSYVSSSTNVPDSEDLDNNKSLDNEGESYFHYEVPIEFDANTAVNPGGMNLTKANFVSDIIRVDKTVQGRWKDSQNEPVFYRIRIPIDQFKSKIGGIQDFRSIRFMRVYMTGFERPITLRFARMELARSQWRRYKRNRLVGGDFPIVPGTDPAQDGTLFDVNAINYEENGDRPTVNYVLPPGILREEVLGQAVASAQKQNEQALSMNVCNLVEEAERGIYKLTNLDLRQYKRLKMFVHAEPKGSTKIEPGELTAYIRLGNDFERNYYEYEIPLTMTDTVALKALGGKLDPEYARLVWPKTNNFDINLAALINLKQERERAQGSAIKPFTRVSPDNLRDSITVKGNPNLGLVKSIMIGVRNRSKTGMPLCAEVWVNELRVNGFDEQGGVAGLARLDVKVADLGRVSLSGAYTGNGYGTIEQRLLQRSREQTSQYDFTTNIELGKFFPKKLGLKVPFTYQVSNKTITPLYDPYDLDVKFKDKVANASVENKDSVRKQALTIDRITNVSFDNVRIEPSTDGKKKPMPWNISNFSVSYQHSENRYSDPIIEAETKTTRRGQLDYNYSIPGGLSITPFKKVIKKDKYLKFLSEFNFSPLPSTLSFNTNIERRLNTTKYRFTPDIDSISTYYNKRFNWDRKYTMNWDFSKGIKMTYNADVTSVIDEPNGKIDTKEKRDSILSNIKNLGRYKTFAQNIGMNYTLPTKQIPFMDWINVRAQVQSTYNWNAAAINTQFLGNTIRNSQNRQINGDFNFEQLYNMSKYLKKINTPIAAKPKEKKPKNRVSDQIKSANDTATDGQEGRKNDRNAAEPTPEVDNQRARLREKMKQGRVAETAKEMVDAAGKAKDALKTATDTTKTDKKGVKKKKEKEEKDREPSLVERAIFRPLMMIRKGRASYTQNFQNTAPGFTQNTGILGQDNATFSAPGGDFVTGFLFSEGLFGQRDRNITLKDRPVGQWLENAASKGWITTSNQLNESVVRNYSEQFQASVTLEPFSDFRIEVDAMANFTKNQTEDFKHTLSTPNDTFAHLAPRDVGSFTVSYFSLAGLFGVDSVVTQKLYNNYNNDSKLISARLARQNNPIGQPLQAHQTDKGYFAGYGRTNAEVAIPAFMAAYTGQDPDKVKLDIFKTVPLPNYKLTYNGLGKLKGLKEKVQSINISHGYKSQLQLNSYNTNTPDFDRNDVYRLDPINKSYYSELNIPGVVLNREFSPLIGIDVKLKNDLSLRVDMKKRYNLQMSFIDNQLSEQKQDEYAVGFGYRMKNVHLKFFDFLNFDQVKKKKAKDDGKEKKNSIIKFKSKEDEKNKPQELDKNGKPIKPKKEKKGNDLTMKCDVAIANGATYQTNLVTGIRVPVRGEFSLKVSPSMDYAVNKQLSLRFEANYNTLRPKTSQSIPTTRFEGKVILRFQLQ